MNGDPELCALLGRCLWNEGDLDRGMKYLVLGERPQELCELIVSDVSDGRARYKSRKQYVCFVFCVCCCAFFSLVLL